MTHETETERRPARVSPWIRRAERRELPAVDRTGDVLARLAREHRCEPGTGCAGSADR